MLNKFNFDQYELVLYNKCLKLGKITASLLKEKCKIRLMERLKKTIEVYDKNAKEYVDFSYPQLLQFHLTQFISYLPKDAKILDAGCGSGKDAEYLVEEGFKVSAIDISSNILKEASKIVDASVEFEQMDILNLKFEDNAFDGVWCEAVLFHIPKEYVMGALEGFYRVMKDKGVIHISVKEGEGEKMVEFPKTGNEPKFFAFYKENELVDLIKKAGFSLIKSFIDRTQEEDWVNIFARKE